MYFSTFLFSDRTLQENLHFVFYCLFSNPHEDTMNSLDQSCSIERSAMIEMFCSIQYGSHIWLLGTGTVAGETEEPNFNFLFVCFFGSYFFSILMAFF